jgi:hypothetical protein
MDVLMSFYLGWDETVKPEKAEIWEIATWVCLSGCLDSVACIVRFYRMQANR